MWNIEIIPGSCDLCQQRQQRRRRRRQQKIKFKMSIETEKKTLQLKHKNSNNNSDSVWNENAQCQRDVKERQRQTTKRKIYVYKNNREWKTNKAAKKQLRNISNSSSGYSNSNDSKANKQKHETIQLTTFYENKRVKGKRERHTIKQRGNEWTKKKTVEIMKAKYRRAAKNQIK